MTEIVTEVDSHAGDEHAHDHPSDWVYIKIALILGTITGVEVFTYFNSVLDWGNFLIPSLMIMMVVKFWLVATWFMHLRFDSTMFAMFFITGIGLATGVYTIFLSTFEFWA